MRKNVFILAFMLTCCMGLAQHPATKQEFPYIHGQMSVSVSYNKNSFIPYKLLEHIGMTGIMRGGNVQVMYGCNNWLELGVAMDACYANRLWRPSEAGGYYVTLPTMQCYVGQEAKAHLFSVFWPEFSLLDLYAVGMLGVTATISTQNLPTRFCPLFQIGAGAELNPSRHFGLFCEYGINTKKNPYTLFGLNIRFGGPKKWQNPKQ